ncbi:unnamed protein product [Linum tenue]|uniref:Uncharacterized protein n=1 Tax=Linum tenue TaxID=586396 RepID=A0AAV0LMY6_9ROSI|nr:unnamed protein product [Linum tenue]
MLITDTVDRVDQERIGYRRRSEQGSVPRVKQALPIKHETLPTSRKNKVLAFRLSLSLFGFACGSHQADVDGHDENEEL